MLSSHGFAERLAGLGFDGRAYAFGIERHAHRQERTCGDQQTSATSPMVAFLNMTRPLLDKNIVRLQLSIERVDRVSGTDSSGAAPAAQTAVTRSPIVAVAEPTPGRCHIHESSVMLRPVGHQRHHAAGNDDLQQEHL